MTDDETELRELVDRWKRHASHLRGELIEAQRKILRLETALEKIADSGNVHPSWLIGDAKRALEQDREPQPSDEQAGLEIDLPQDQKDDVEQQHDEGEERPNPRTRKRVSRHVLH